MWTNQCRHTGQKLVYRQGFQKSSGHFRFSVQLQETSDRTSVTNRPSQTWWNCSRSYLLLSSCLHLIKAFYFLLSMKLCDTGAVSSPLFHQVSEQGLWTVSWSTNLKTLWHLSSFVCLWITLYHFINKGFTSLFAGPEDTQTHVLYTDGHTWRNRRSQVATRCDKLEAHRLLPVYTELCYILQLEEWWWYSS